MNDSERFEHIRLKVEADFAKSRKRKLLASIFPLAGGIVLTVFLIYATFRAHELNQEVQKLQQEIQQLEKERSNINQEIRSARQTLTSLETRISSLRGLAISDESVDSQKVVDSLNQVSSEVSALDKQLERTAQEDGYRLNECGSITDTRTNLEWFIGPDQNLKWDEAQTWVANLNACQGNWRMPTADELSTLYRPGMTAGTGHIVQSESFPAKMHPVFNAIGGGSWVWAAETSGDEARSFNFNQGFPVWYSKNNIKDGVELSTRAFAVREANN